MFAHGYTGEIAFGHGMGLSSNATENLTWTVEKIQNIDSKAFQKANSLFYSCNTGTVKDGISFAQEWSNITKGKTKAAYGENEAGFTWYGYINSFWGSPLGLWFINKQRRDKVGGYGLPYPALSKPTLTKTARWKTFKPEEGCED